MSPPTTSNVDGGATPPQADVIILIMGMTGSGKSSFIKLVTGDEGIKVGHGFSSQTSEIGIHHWNAPDGRLLAFVDTPGFDDSNGKTDTDVLNDIASYLQGTYGRINGLIYCQRIDVRAGGLTIRNLMMFEKVCGLALKNAALVTTRWDVVGNETGVKLEQELVTDERYFKPLCDAGAATFGHDNTRASAQRVMDLVLKNNPIILQIQEELSRPGMTLDQTAAGSELSADLAAAIKRHEEEIKEARRKMENAMKDRDEAWQRRLKSELSRLEQDMKRTTESREQLRQPPSKPRVFERLMLKGAEGARKSGMFGMVFGLGKGLVGETFRAIKNF